MTVFVILGSLFVFVAAVIHVLIFFMECITWSKPTTWKRFGLTSQADADTVKPMAFNQGFYNLFLAIGVGIGLIMIGSNVAGGVPIALFAAGSMVAAALVLLLSNRKLARAAIIQGAAPLLGIIFLVLALTTV